MLPHGLVTFYNFIDMIHFLCLPSNLFSIGLLFFFKYKSFIVITTCSLWTIVKFSSVFKLVVSETD